VSSRRLNTSALWAVALTAAVAGGVALHLVRARVGLDLALAVAVAAALGAGVGTMARPSLPDAAVRLLGGAAAIAALVTAALVQHGSATAADAEYRSQVAVAGVQSERPPLPGPARYVAGRLGLAPGPERLLAVAELLGAAAAGSAAAVWSRSR